MPTDRGGRAARRDGADEWRPSASLEVLKLRATILRQVRDFFFQHGYWEVETPLLSADVCVDASIDPFALDAGGLDFYLQTSPEFALKRLLCAGADQVFEVTRSFRQGESGRLHNPEFTIIEWYRVGATYRAQMDFVQRFVVSLVKSLSQSVATPALPTFRSITYEEAFLEFAGVSAMSAPSDQLQCRARQLQVVIPESLAQSDRDGWLNLLLAEVVEPRLAALGAVFLYDYPPSQSAIARILSGETPVAERFELYLDGIEICNGYQELTDGEVLRRRMEDRSMQRSQAGKPPLPAQSRLLTAMRERRLPECSGVALGFDRLVMWLLGKSSIADVMSFSRDRA
jgi:lysyl-tRNA synthetase class 2